MNVTNQYYFTKTVLFFYSNSFYRYFSNYKCLKKLTNLLYFKFPFLFLDFLNYFFFIEIETNY